VDYECITNRIQPHFIFSTNTMDYECITNRIQPHFIFSTNTQWIMNLSPAEYSHTSHSALTHIGLWMCHPQTSATLHIQQLHALGYPCISNRIQPHFISSTNTNWIMKVSPTDFSHISYYLYSFPWAGVSLFNSTQVTFRITIWSGTVTSLLLQHTTRFTELPH